jgi:site-specific DNA-methyltransferase (adenine-specific)
VSVTAAAPVEISAARRVERIGNATLYLGDCRDLLHTLPLADCVITDPPYSVNTHANAKTNKGAGHGVKQVTFDALTDREFSDVMLLCLSRSRGWIVATCDYRHARLTYDWPQFVRLGAWVKPNPMPQISADRPGQGFEVVLVLHSGATEKAWNRGGGSGVWIFPPVQSASVPTEKPIALAAALVSDFTQQGQTVADPFMGSGTFGVACVRSGRCYIGIEADAGRFDIACERIENAQRQQSLLDPHDAVTRSYEQLSVLP